MRGQSIHKNTSPLHPILLARLTGKLGDKKTIEKISSSLGYLYKKFLPKIFKEKMDLDVDISYTSCQSGKFSHIIHSFKENFVFSQASLSSWSSNFFIGCSNNLVITLLENLLGASHETIPQLYNRSLSTVEKKLAKRTIAQISAVLNQCISTSQESSPKLEDFYDIDYLKKNTNRLSNEFVTTINMNMTIENVASSFVLIIPQETLLKTTLIALSSQNKSEKQSEDLIDPFARKTYQLNVNIDTRINLKKTTLKDVVTLKIGQVIPFLHREKTCAILSANGKEIYSCELGRVGKNYTIRITDRINFDQKSLKNFLHKR
ncbi:flagellar motor switch protein FliM [Candidatus Liberibacter asiaticus]|uniref:FliM/FliN family flagellar motor switch protein n=1 Tax=Liberibacter asiaticus TaxID=34021 RepID=UPI0012F52350|nr:FliM/FliN family flagellar motor switch protein [Candidatus Liberibacter asiaticus]KAE9515497.1 flagellar motor switch protein FliM [Candidatus Liberibacter asiaticus]